MLTRSWSMLVAGALLVLEPAAAMAQRSQAESPSMRDLIQQLQPQTRGIRMPSEQPGATPAGPPAAPPSRLAATTAPAGVSAASISVRFATGSAELTPAAARSLDALGQALSSQQLTPYRFRIEGHTDTVGSAELNRSLSERRAMTVRDYLTGRYGVGADRLEAVGLGESQLL
ncbi:MAG: OmpA family protein, partial [Acetobacteraceae bacterium]